MADEWADFKPLRFNDPLDSLSSNQSRRSFFMAAGAAGVSAAALSLGSTIAKDQGSRYLSDFA
ncbi:hypothetical protein [Granulosicoccus antarcticus]|uniref:hypothetical protein n=1 Tax=Granulosicoccus antarcticus TaxID=437505 RepID=UPI00146F9E58|nr:hypothetical protein [Granulosicoccus antarcticus]